MGAAGAGALLGAVVGFPGPRGFCAANIAVTLALAARASALCAAL